MIWSKVVVNVMLFQMGVMSPPPALGVIALGVSLVS